MGFSAREQSWLNALDKWKTTPDDEDDAFVCECDSCGKDLYAGDTAYRIMGETWCEKCVDNARTELDYPDDYED